MGNWILSIEGTGAHHNDKDIDADALGRAVVKTLREAGQQIEHVTLTYGCRDNLLSEYKFTMNHKEFSSPRASLSGAVLKHMSGCPAMYLLFRETDTGDIHISDFDAIGIADEKFYTVPSATF